MKLFIILKPGITLKNFYMTFTCLEKLYVTLVKYPTGHSPTLHGHVTCAKQTIIAFKQKNNKTKFNIYCQLSSTL
jgi:hypothetical protein